MEGVGRGFDGGLVAESPAARGDWGLGTKTLVTGGWRSGGKAPSRWRQGGQLWAIFAIFQ